MSDYLMIQLFDDSDYLTVYFDDSMFAHNGKYFFLPTESCLVIRV